MHRRERTGVRVEDLRFDARSEHQELVFADVQLPPAANAAADSTSGAADAMMLRTIQLSSDLGSTTPPPGQRHPWTVEQSGTTADLYAVWGSSANDVYAVGADGTILHSTGAGDWTREGAPSTAAFTYFRAIWGSCPHDVHVVGEAGGNSVWNGVHYKRNASGTWAPAPSPSTMTPCTAIWGRSDQELFIATDQNGNPATINRTTAGGASWSAVSITWPNARVFLNGIWGNAAGQLWLSGVVVPSHPGL